MARQVVFVLDMVSDTNADEVGFDVVGGKAKCGEEVVEKIVTQPYFLVKQEGMGRNRLVVSDAQVEYEAHAVKHHLVDEEPSYLVLVFEF